MPRSDSSILMSASCTDLREVSSARISCDDTDLQCTGRNQPICSSRAMPSASRRSVLIGIAFSLKLAPVKGFRKREIARGAKHWLAPGAAVVTDGLGCWSALEEAACSHQAIRTGSRRQAARMASFKSVNTTLGNIKSAITGTYRKLGPDHAGRYLASFAWRYNPRYQLQTMIPRFVHSAARTQPMPYRLLIAG